MKNLECIMLVDDDSDDLFIHAREIEKLSSAIITISKDTGKKALEYIKSRESIADSLYPDIIFLDINMPAMNGWDFLKEYDKLDSEIQNHARIMMLTTSDNLTDKVKASQWHYVTEYVIKPLTKVKLQAIIAKYFAPM